MHDALEVGRHVFEHLPLVGADPAELLSAASRAEQGASWTIVSVGR